MIIKENPGAGGTATGARCGSTVEDDRTEPTPTCWPQLLPHVSSHRDGRDPAKALQSLNCAGVTAWKG